MLTQIGTIWVNSHALFLNLVVLFLKIKKQLKTETIPDHIYKYIIVKYNRYGEKYTCVGGHIGVF